MNKLIALASLYGPLSLLNTNKEENVQSPDNTVDSGFNG
jgi:hypothetical protein